MKEMELSSLEYTDGNSTIKMERGAAVAVQAAAPVQIIMEEAAPEQTEAAAAASGIFTVKSPMVGVFYAAPGADLKPYVEAGDAVHAGDVLCIIEAMKMMNEITAERDGIIAEICVFNKQVVEFDQPLFRIDTL